MKRKRWRMSDIVWPNFCSCAGVSVVRGGSETFGFVPVSLTLISILRTSIEKRMAYRARGS
jgi:hypothetical protein